MRREMSRSFLLAKQLGSSYGPVWSAMPGIRYSDPAIVNASRPNPRRCHGVHSNAKASSGPVRITTATKTFSAALRSMCNSRWAKPCTMLIGRLTSTIGSYCERCRALLLAAFRGEQLFLFVQQPAAGRGGVGYFGAVPVDLGREPRVGKRQLHLRDGAADHLDFVQFRQVLRAHAGGDRLGAGRQLDLGFQADVLLAALDHDHDGLLVERPIEDLGVFAGLAQFLATQL